ncbi:MAG: M14 family zinc carboxypeptidase, partial [Candidatus Eisenbacteria bacterium]
MHTWRPALAALLLAALLLPSSAPAYPRDDAALVEVDALSRADIERLNELGMDIVNVQNGVARIAAIPSEIDVLWANGFRPRVTLARMRDALWSIDQPDRGVYHSYAEVTADLAAWAAAHPSITRLESIGQSYGGREIWALKITDNPTVEEFEPEVHWIGGHHGNETIGIEVCYYAIEHLLDNYGTDPDVTWLVNEREFWVIPVFNPDGHVAGSRYNGNGEDLNRNYLCPCGDNAATAFSEPETQALRDWCVGRNPVTSLTFHSGAVYVNYLWDYTYNPTPDEPMLITISNGYSSYTGLPVTNGADWYVVHGSCQDWCYDTRGEIDTTIEVSTSYEPPASQIDAIASANIDAMLYQAKLSGRGVRGIVTDGGNGEPLYATISIPEIGKDVYTDPDVGDYHRMVESGTYTVTCTAEGYPPQTVYNVTASLDTFVVVNFALEPPPRGTIAGYVTDDQANPIAATVELTDMGGYSATADPGTGYYEIAQIPVGLHDVRASLSGYASVERQDVSVLELTTTSEDFELQTPLFFDDLEAGVGEWTGDWSLTTGKSSSPTHSLTDSPGGNYGNYASTTTTLAAAVDLTGHATAALAFDLWCDTETGYDYLYVEASGTGGAPWTQIASYEGPLGGWSTEEIDLTAYAGSSAFKVRFILDSDSYITRDGAYVDNVAVFGDPTLTGIDDDALVGRLAVANYPNPFNPRTSVRYEVPSAGHVSLRVYDVAGRLVKTLVDTELESGGRHEVEWDGRDESGAPVAAGVYFARALAQGRDSST